MGAELKTETNKMRENLEMRRTGTEEMKIRDAAVPGVIRCWSWLVILDILHQDIECCLLDQPILMVPDN